ncbi:MAG: hypothetical protein GY796_11715 [Chloroflexi bacterium]|nr:hypothetical protein [Chloroflexota bacterium]
MQEISNPIDSDIRQAILAADVMMGHDGNCMVWITANRPPTNDADKGARRERRRRRRRS